MKKVKEIDDEDEWSIKGFKSFSIAAVEYFPEYTSTDAAIKRMRHDIENDAQLLADLKPTHYTHKTARLSPNNSAYFSPPGDLPRLSCAVMTKHRKTRSRQNTEKMS